MAKPKSTTADGRTLEDLEDRILELEAELELSRKALAKAEAGAPAPAPRRSGETVSAFAIVARGNLWALVRGNVPADFADTESELDTLGATVGKFSALMRQRLENPAIEARILHRRLS